MQTGTPKFTGVVLGIVNINFVQKQTVTLDAKIAFVNPAAGTTYGWMDAAGGWSSETMTRLAALRESMEIDVANSVFENFEAQTSIDSPVKQKQPMGLGESLGMDEDDAPPV